MIGSHLYNSQSKGKAGLVSGAALRTIGTLKVTGIASLTRYGPRFAQIARQ